MTKATNLTEILETMHADTNEDGKLQVREVVSALRYRGYGPLLLAASLLTILPTGAIPGVPSITAVLIILIAGQLVVGRPAPWLPKFLGDLSIDRDKFEQARVAAEPYTKRFDRLIKPRLKFMTLDIFNRIIAALCVLIAMTMPILGFIPFAALVPALAIGLFGVGLSGKDGAFTIAGFAVLAAGGYIIYHFNQ